MNRLGVIIDVAHATDRAFWQILEESACPVLSSHSGLRALNYIERNLSDDMVRAIAASHGLIGIMLHPPYLKRHSLLASIDVVVDHIEKAAELTSPRNVCIGTDMDGYILLPRGFRDVTSMPLLTWKLLQRGFTREDVECILGQNFLRFFSESTRTNAGV
jgi:membrane dipeptidase